MTEPTYVERDEELANLVAVANASGDDYRYPVTLVVSGIAVAGFMIPGSVYASGVSKVDPFFETLEEEYSEDSEAQNVTEDVVASIGYVHLADANIFAGSHRLVVGYWRGLLGRVDGFSLGTLE